MNIPLPVGKTSIQMRPLLIDQLPLATEIAMVLFSDKKVRFQDDHVILRLQNKHIELMKNLLILVTDVPKEKLALPIKDFIVLFNNMLEMNADFFLSVTMEMQITIAEPPGQTSFNDSDNTATTIQAGSP